MSGAPASTAMRRNTGAAVSRLIRRFRGLTWKLLGVFCLVVAIQHVLLALFPIWDGERIAPVLLDTFQSTLVNGALFLPVLFAVVFVESFELPSTGRRILALVSAVALGTVAGELIQAWLEHLIWSVEAESQTHIAESPWRLMTALVGGWLVTFSVAGTGAAFYFYVKRDAEASAGLHQEELDRISLDRQMTEARLQVMQSQIEPHFLFNTLANVRRLYQTNPPAGRSMLQHLRSYLSAALPEMRISQTTLGRELALTVAYLNVQKIRMGARLTFDVDIPERLKATAIPPMMLVTLVENAIKHGLTPLPQGGLISIVAREQRGALRLQVSDTGAGLTKSTGTGVGLANIRTRLSTLYGGRGQLLLDHNVPNGVTATIELPVGTTGAFEP